MANRDRWQHVDRLFHAALARDKSERRAFLREACHGDEPLLHEVESLLTFENDAQEFMDGSAFEIAPSLLQPEAATPLIGQRLGPYEIGTLLGAGGMGDVYRARDTTLGRDVAIKILPDVFTTDGDRRVRFEREARLLAALNHPHIGAIYGFEQREGTQGLVLELVEGPTLADRLRAGPLPIAEVLTIARQIAGALQAAHEKGIVHRDLKPANIVLQGGAGRISAARIAPAGGHQTLPAGVGSPSRVRDDVNVKVLDFGLAKATDEESGLRSGSPQADSATSDGLILGTPAYMSPEQVRGKVVDARTDIWAFGCVLYQMLTGCAAFAGETVSDTIASILDREPDWELLPSGTPHSLARLLQRCLDKDLDRRLRDIADAQIEIDNALDARPEPSRKAPPAATHTATRPWAWASRQTSAIPGASRREGRNRSWKALGAALLAVALIVGGGLSLRSTRPSRNELTYTQLTNFTDSAVSPALSPDGRMLAFVRGDDWWLSPGQIYVKLLPNGEPVQITDDSRQKYGPAFSPDGSRIAYTVFPWSTYVVSPLGGASTLLLPNSSGVTWLDERRILFSEVNPPTGLHMGVVTALENRSDQRTVYFPQDERGMVHLSYPSPDRKWVLAVEMNPVWQPCRVVPLDGGSAGWQVGPKGPCTSAAWSPDGKWMYFGVEVDGHHHLWRQRFPDGQAEQITSGPTEEQGVAVAPDGSLITSIGTRQSAVWIHDARGDRPLSSQGHVTYAQSTGLLGNIPLFSRDGKSLFYVKSESAGAPTELWRTDIASEKSEKALPGISMLEFDLSDDAEEVVYSVQPPGKPSQLWVATLDRRSPPRLISASGENSPHFGSDGQIVFRSFDGTSHHLEQINLDGSGRSRVVPYPIGNLFFISSDRRWITTVATMPDGIGGTYAVPITGGAPRRICSGCPVMWSPDGKFLYVFVERPSRDDPGKTRVFPLPPGEMLPKLPPLGMRAPTAPDDPTLFPGSYLVDGYGLSPSPDPTVYAYVKTTIHRNLFRVALP